MSELRIQQLFESRLAAWADDQGIPVAFPNASFDPNTQAVDDGGKPRTYIRADLLSGTPTSQTLETSTTFVGVFQMSIYAPRNEGTGPTGLIVEQLRALFPCDKPVTADDGFSVGDHKPARCSARIRRRHALDHADELQLPR
jgi:hypothetical protein